MNDHLHPLEGTYAPLHTASFLIPSISTLPRTWSHGARPLDATDWTTGQLVSRAAADGDEVIGVFSAAGLKKPDIFILSDEFLAEVRNLVQLGRAGLLRQHVEKGRAGRQVAAERGDVCHEASYREHLVS